MNLPPALLSRFDLIFLLIDKINEELDKIETYVEDKIEDVEHAAEEKLEAMAENALNSLC